MPFVKGKPKTGGRKPGVKNKVNCRDFMEALEKLDINLMACLIQDMATQPPFQRVESWLQMMQFAYPKKGAQPTLTTNETSNFFVVQQRSGEKLVLGIDSGNPDEPKDS
jgi:hypothetical protein